MADGSHFVKNVKKKKSWYRSEMARNAIESEFGHPKWPTAAIMSKISKKIKVAYRSEMARNAIESDFRTSKIKKKIRIDLKWPEMRSKVNLGHPKWPTAAILSKSSKNKKLHIDLKWPEIQSKINCGHPKWAPAAFLQKFQQQKSCASI